jgi:hypothetical protein
MAAPKTTKYDDETLEAPQSTDPGDAPADTYDRTQRVSSATPDKAAAAEAGFLTVNAVVQVDDLPDTTPTGNRSETYEVYGPDGNPVTVTHNYDTGVTEIDES